MERKLPSQREGNRVAVIGLGLHGVTMVKNLLEQGFDVVGFERNNYVGGLWKYSTEPHQTTVLKSTKSNISKQRVQEGSQLVGFQMIRIDNIQNAYPDFPFPDDVPDYPSGEQVAAYIDSYATHFNLTPHFRLGVVINRLDRSADDSSWALEIMKADLKPRAELFDRVVVTTGAQAKAYIPNIEGSEHFKGRLLHSQAFKDPKEFAAKRIVVVGMSNTGCDIAVDLSGIADKIYLSHRAGARIWPRHNSTGTALDHRGNRRMSSFGLRLNRVLPVITGKLAEKVVEREMRSAAGGKLRPEWNLLPAPSIRNVAPIVNDSVLRCFANGSVEPVTGLRRLFPSKEGQTTSTVELIDGKILEDIDAIIYSTGYHSTYDILGPTADPTAFATPEWDNAPYSNGIAYPRLYQGLFSTTYPQTLVFVGPYRGHSIAAFNNLDLSAQAITRIWAGHFPLPPKREMEAWCDTNYRESLADVQRWRIPKVGTNPWKLEYWLNEAAGNRVNECLGWGLTGWRFWWKDRELCNLILGGLDTPFIYRLFEPAPGGRKAWSGAREAILKANHRS